MAHMEFCKALEENKEIIVGSKWFLCVLEGPLGVVKSAEGILKVLINVQVLL